jgi:hypothetical protein
MQETTVLDLNAVIAEHHLDVVKVDSPCFQGPNGEELRVKTRMHKNPHDFADYLAGMRLKYPTVQAYLYEVRRYEANKEDREWYAIRYALALASST